MIYNLEDSFLKIKANKIKEVFINLIDNAIKYSVNSNNIEVHGFIEDNFYRVSIINEANLIPDEIYSHVFEPFIKINSHDDNYSSGLGLYLCSEIIKDHNGSITLSNGTKVEALVSLPLPHNSL
ncbi:sensor histidine kinase [Clostridium sp. MB05]|uniref:sensor histidine kinase n=1 Tax=Clostridium sp. MB05 TaxID=3376682 RepID=UPI003981FC70